MHDDRRKKLETLRASKIQPYPARFDRTHTSASALELSKKGLRTVEEITNGTQKEIRIAGRIMTLREHGKLVFANLQDQDGQIQICWMQGFTPHDQWDRIPLLDLGDFVGCTGELFTTKHGELTLLINDYQLLSKSLRPLPEKWHGLKDREKCYRERHLDLVMNEETRLRFQFRSRLVYHLRQFYHQHGFMELETPVLENISSGASAKPFITHHNALDIDVYLRIAAGELWQKMAVVGGFERTFEVGRVFRNEGLDPSHLQEFTMIEHYAAYWDYQKNMDFTEQMFSHLFKELLGTMKVKIKDPSGEECDIDFTPPWPRKKFYDLVHHDSGIDVSKIKDIDALRQAILKKGIEIEGMDKMGYGNLIDHLYKKVSRPKLIQPTFVIQHPVDMKPLARRNDENPDVCDTFQLLVNGWEVVNAYSEIIDPLDQRSRFETQSKAKAHGDEEAMSMNEEYLTAMEHGMPPMSGWGLGIDRLVSLLTQQDNLKDVVLFPMMRPVGTPPFAGANTSPLQGEANCPPVDDGKNIDVGISYTDAQKLFDTHVKNKAIRNHSREAEMVMRALAKRLGANEEAWGILGLLHDIDWDPDVFDVKSHGIHCEEILSKGGMSPEGIQVIKSHVYGIQGYDHPLEKEVRTRLIEHALAAGETITGLIYACALVRPDKKLAQVEVSSVKKKFKEKSFAAGVQRSVVMECEKLGLSLDEFLALALDAIKPIAHEVGV